MTTTASTHQIGLPVGTWTIDTVHSSVGFWVRHLMISKVRGSFTSFHGQVVVCADGTASLDVTIAVASLTTHDEKRDAHVRSPDFLDASAYPEMTYSAAFVPDVGGSFLVPGQLTVHGVTRPVGLDVELNGMSAGLGAGPVVGFSATAALDRTEFGIVLNPRVGGDAVVGSTISIVLEVELTQL